MSGERQTIPLPKTGELPVLAVFLQRFDIKSASQLASLAAPPPFYGIAFASPTGFSSNPISCAFRASPFSVRSWYDAS